MLVAGEETLYVNQFFVLQPGRRPTKHIYVGDTRVVSKTDPLSEAPYLSYYHTDHLGSTSYITVQNQNLVQHERAFPFGEPDIAEQPERNTSETQRRDWLFTGKEYDNNTNLFYFGARYYAPRTALWQSPDPILASYMSGKVNGGVFTPGNLGLFTYTWNNPVLLYDPDGRVAWTRDQIAAEAFGPQLPAQAQAEVDEGAARGAAVAIAGTAAIAAVVAGGSALVGGFLARIAPRLAQVGVGTAGGVGVVAGQGAARDVVRARLGDIGAFLRDNSARIADKLGDRLGKSGLPFERGRAGFAGATQAIRDTLTSATHVSDVFPASRAQNAVYDVYSAVTNFTVRIGADGVFETLIPEATPVIRGSWQ